MCMIIDVNFFSGNVSIDDYEPIVKWLLDWRKGKIIFSQVGEKQSEKEFNSSIPAKFREKFPDSFDQLARVGAFQELKEEDVEQKKNEIKNRDKIDLKSNDAHILAMAELGNARILATYDKDLMKDFKGIIRGSIYKDKDHKGLLRKDTCP